jgi:hypothetical protein
MANDVLPEPILLFLVRLALILLGYLLLRLLQRLFRNLARTTVRRVLSRLHSPDAEAIVFDVVRTSANLVALAAFMVFVAAVLSDLRDVFVLLLRMAQTALLGGGGAGLLPAGHVRFRQPGARAQGHQHRPAAHAAALCAHRAASAASPAWRCCVGLQMGLRDHLAHRCAGRGQASTVSLAAQDTLEQPVRLRRHRGRSAVRGGRLSALRTPDVEGTVEHVGLRSTRFRQVDQSFVTVPNTRLANAAIVDATQLSKRVRGRSGGGRALHHLHRGHPERAGGCCARAAGRRSPD